MTINSTSSGSSWFLNGLAEVQRQQEKTQRDISSGYRVHNASDAPLETPRLVTLSSRLAAFQNWQSNLAQVKAEAQAGDSAIGSAVSLIENARVLAVRGATATTTAAGRATLADQVQSLQSELLSAANTTVAGRYIFAGDQDQAPPYVLDPASTSGVTAATPQTSTRVVTAPDGEQIFRSLTATQVFDDPSASAFGVLQELQNALRNNDVPGISGALLSLQEVSDWLNQQQGIYGNSEQRISDAQSAAGNEILSLQSGIAAIRDTDIAQAATDLTRENTSQSAALAAQAQISRKTLFDYLG